MNLHKFYAMGGYALYVWPAFAVVLSTFSVQWVLAKKHRRKIIGKIKEVSCDKVIK